MTENKIFENLRDRLAALYSFATEKKWIEFGGTLVVLSSDENGLVMIKAKFSYPNDYHYVLIDYNDYEIGINLQDTTEIEDGLEESLLKAIAHLLFKVAQHYGKGAKWEWMPTDEEGLNKLLNKK